MFGLDDSYETQFGFCSELFSSLAYSDRESTQVGATISAGTSNASDEGPWMERGIAPRECLNRPLVETTVDHLYRKYLWWAEPSDPPPLERLFAQLMQLGTYEDVRWARQKFGDEPFRRALREAPAGVLIPEVNGLLRSVTLKLSPLSSEPGTFVVWLNPYWLTSPAWIPRYPKNMP